MKWIKSTTFSCSSVTWGWCLWALLRGKNETAIQGPAPSLAQNSSLINHSITSNYILFLPKALVLTPCDDRDWKVWADEKGHLFSPARSLLNAGTQSRTPVSFVVCVWTPSTPQPSLEALCPMTLGYGLLFTLSNLFHLALFFNPPHHFLNSVFTVSCVLAFLCILPQDVSP